MVSDDVRDLTIENQFRGVASCLRAAAVCTFILACPASCLAGTLRADLSGALVLVSAALGTGLLWLAHHLRRHSNAARLATQAVILTGLAGRAFFVATLVLGRSDGHVGDATLLLLLGFAGFDCALAVVTLRSLVGARAAAACDVRYRQLLAAQPASRSSSAPYLTLFGARVILGFLLGLFVLGDLTGRLP